METQAEPFTLPDRESRRPGGIRYQDKRGSHVETSSKAEMHSHEEESKVVKMPGSPLEVPYFIFLCLMLKWTCCQEDEIRIKKERRYRYTAGTLFDLKKNKPSCIVHM